MRRDREFWKQLVGEVEGGESIAAVARRHRVQAKTLTWWRWKLRGARGRSVEARLLPVVVKHAEARIGSVIELRVRDVTMRILAGSDVAYVVALVDALRG